MLNYKSAVGLYISEEMISVAKFKKSGNAINLVTCGAEHGSFNKGNFSQVISQLLKKCEIVNEELFVCFNMPNVMIKEIEISQMEDRLVENALKYEIQNHTPYPVNNIVYGFITQNINTADKKKVLIGISKKDELATYVSILDNSKLKVASLNLQQAALSNYYTYASHDIAQESVLVLDLNFSKKISLSIIEKGILRFSKVINYALPSSIPTPEYVDPVWKEILEEIESSITYFQTIQGGKRSRYIIFYNERGVLDDVKQFLSQRVQMEVFSAPQVVEPEFFVPLGLAAYAMGQGRCLELGEKSFSSGINNNNKIVAVIIALFLFVGSFYVDEIFIQTNLSNLNREIKLYEKSSQEIKKIEKNNEELRKEILFFKDTEEPVNCLAVLNEIYTFVPEGNVLKDINVKNNGQVIISGLTKDAESLIANLKDSTFLKKVKLEGNSRKDKNFEDYNVFKISAYFFQGKDGKQGMET